MRLFFFIILTIPFILSAQTVTDTVYTDGHAFLDSVYQANNRAVKPVFAVVFSAELTDTAKFLPSTKVRGSCTEIAFLQPKVLRSFDTLEYFQLISTPRADFNDSVEFLRGNDIIEQWQRLFVCRDTQIVKIESLGRDINVDFGKVNSTSFYNNSTLAIYINTYCMTGKGLALVRTFNLHENKLLENCYTVYANKIVRELEYP
ncbi:MAG: hypothetical protein HYV28_09890 [Ignavibacteriales bacterium]|nr:hypothetical protein [Ignavibacteriales bacterium]